MTAWKKAAKLTANFQSVSDNEKINIGAAVSALNLNVNVDSLDDLSRFNIIHAYKSAMTCYGCTGKNPRCSVPYKSIITVKDNQVTCKDEKCILKQAWDIMRVSGVPSRYIGLRTTDYKLSAQNQNAARAAVNCIDSGASLFISGNVRTGKTLLSCIICNERAFQLKRSLFITVTDLMATLYDFADTFQRNEALRRYKNAPCLVIDDLGAEYQSDFSASSIFSIVDSRYKNNLQTIINSNFNLRELSEHLRGYQGERICRRIIDLCQVVTV